MPRTDFVTESDYLALRNQLVKSRYQLLLDLSWWLGQPWGKLLELRISNLYHPNGSPASAVRFKALTKNKQKRRFLVPVHSELRKILASTGFEYSSALVFESRHRPGEPVILRTATFALEKAIQRAELGHKNISSNSFRRSFCLRLHRRGMDLRQIQRLTGHSDTKGVSRLLEAEPPIRLEKVIAVL